MNIKTAIERSISNNEIVRVDAALVDVPDVEGSVTTNDGNVDVWGTTDGEEWRLLLTPAPSSTPITDHFQRWGDAENFAQGFEHFVGDYRDESRAALADGFGEWFDELVSNVAYSVAQDHRVVDVTELEAAEWLLENRDDLLRQLAKVDI